MFTEQEYKYYLNKYNSDKKLIELAKKIDEFANASKECNTEEKLGAFAIALTMLNQN